MIEPLLKVVQNRDDYNIIYDIGSRDCIQSIELYNAFPKARIYAFECNPNTIELCKQNIKPYLDRITLIEGAVCDYNGTITFYPINKDKTITTWIDGNPGASSLFKATGKYPAETYVQDEIIVNCHRLDSLGIPPPDLIWMDLQGAELLALKGLGERLSYVKLIFTEISYQEIYHNQVLFNELNTFLIDNKFSLQNTLSLSGWQEDAIYKKITN
jgi:FkbM family methyltransferase